MNFDEFLATVTAAREGADTVTAASTDIKWKKLDNGRIYGIGPVEVSSIESDPEFPDYELGTSREEILPSELEEAEREEQGDVSVCEPPADPEDPAWQRYCREARAWREAQLGGARSGPKPVPPPQPSLRENPAFRDHLRRRAAERRQRMRPLQHRLLLERHRARRRQPVLLSVRRRTHGTRRRAGAAPSRRSSSSSRGDPHLRGEGDDPPDLLQALTHYLSRVGSHGAERSWLVDQVAWLGFPEWRVSVALTLMVAEGRAEASIGDADASVVSCRRRGP